MAVGWLVFYLLNRPVIRHNKAVLSERERLKNVFLKKFHEKFGDLTPEEVATPYTWGGRNVKYILVPEGIQDELQYEDYED